MSLTFFFAFLSFFLPKSFHDAQNASNYVKYVPVVYFIYSKIPVLRPPLGLSKSGPKDHFWTVPKVVSNQRYTGCRK